MFSGMWRWLTGNKKLGVLTAVANMKAYQSANDAYMHVTVRNVDGIDIDLLLTQNDIDRAVKRAEKNKEDYAKI